MCDNNPLDESLKAKKGTINSARAKCVYKYRGIYFYNSFCQATNVLTHTHPFNINQYGIIYACRSMETICT